MKKEKREQLIFRNEWKHSMDQTDYLTIRNRLASIAGDSMYAGLGGMYRVRNLTFTQTDGDRHPDLLSSIGRRESFRIRYYNENTDYIRLEKKTRVGGKTNKQSVPLSEEECRRILAGDTEWMAESVEPLMKEFYARISSGELKAQTVADFRREAFVYRPCNVRITMDSRLETGIPAERFLDLDWRRQNAADTAPAQSAVTGDGLGYSLKQQKEAVIMEIKYDCFLPEVIRAAIRVTQKRPSSFARYEARHAYGQM